MRVSSFFVVMILCSGNFMAYSQEGNDRNTIITNLSGAHSVYFSAGFKMNSSTSASVSTLEVKTETNFIGFIGYQYWFSNEGAVNLTVGSFSSESNVSYMNISSNSIVPILFGFSYYPKKLSLGRVGRVRVGANMGIYMGNASKTNVSFVNIGSSAVNETVFGVEPNAGVDFFVTNWLRIGPSISYHFISEFKEVIGDRKNYSGPVFLFNIGVVL